MWFLLSKGEFVVLVGNAKTVQLLLEKGVEITSLWRTGVVEYVRGMTHMNCMEVFGLMLKHVYVDIYHMLSVKHLDWHLSRFAVRHNQRDLDILKQMAGTVAVVTNKLLSYKQMTSEAV